MLPIDQKVAIHVDRTWHFYRGFVYGLSQAAIVGQLRISSTKHDEMIAIDRTIKALAEDLPYEPPSAKGEMGLAMRVARLAIALQIHGKIPVSDGHVLVEEGVDTNGRSLIRLALPCHATKVALLSLQWAIRTINALLCNGIGQLEDSNRSFVEIMQQLRKFSVPGLNTFHFVRAGYELGFPVRRIVPEIYSFGTGCHIRLLDSSLTDRTSVIGVKIAGNKLATAHLLGSAGLPASQPKAVATADEAASVARHLGFPVVVKPLDQDQGRGVFAGLLDESSVRQAFAEARQFSKRIIVERHFAGRDFRLTVIAGRVAKVEERVAGGITGDGCSTVAELVTQMQAHPRFQKILIETNKMVLTLDAEATGLLREAGLAPDSIVEAGQRVPLRRKNNVSTGGEQIAIALDAVHPDNLALAARAAALLQLDFAGIDLLIADIGRSWKEIGALICEVNAKPQVGIRTSPTIYTEILRDLVGSVTRIPTHLVITADVATPNRSQLLSLADELSCNGVSTVEGIYINGEMLQGQPGSGFASARTLLAEPAANAALCVVPSGEIFRDGLPCDWFESIRIPSGCSVPSTVAGMLRPHTSNWIEARADA